MSSFDFISGSFISRPLVQRTVADFRAGMPPAEQGVAVTGGFQNIGAITITLCKMHDPTALRMRPGKMLSPRRAAHSMRTSRGEADAGGGERSHWRMQQTGEKKGKSGIHGVESR